MPRARARGLCPLEEGGWLGSRHAPAGVLCACGGRRIALARFLPRQPTRPPAAGRNRSPYPHFSLPHCKKPVAGGAVNYAAVLDTAADVARAMAHLHRQHVIHSDLKARNVLLKSDGADGRGVVAKGAPAPRRAAPLRPRPAPCLLALHCSRRPARRSARASLFKWSAAPSPLKSHHSPTNDNANNDTKQSPTLASACASTSLARLTCRRAAARWCDLGGRGATGGHPIRVSPPTPTSLRASSSASHNLTPPPPLLPDADAHGARGAARGARVQGQRRCATTSGSGRCRLGAASLRLVLCLNRRPPSHLNAHSSKHPNQNRASTQTTSL